MEKSYLLITNYFKPIRDIQDEITKKCSFLREVLRVAWKVDNKKMLTSSFLITRLVCGGENSKLVFDLLSISHKSGR